MQKSQFIEILSNYHAYISGSNVTDEKRSIAERFTNSMDIVFEPESEIGIGENEVIEPKETIIE